MEITKDVGTCILTGIITDTGGFKYQGTNVETFEFVAELLNKGINVSKIYRRVLETTTRTSFELRRIAESRLEFFFDDKAAGRRFFCYCCLFFYFKIMVRFFIIVSFKKEIVELNSRFGFGFPVAPWAWIPFFPCFSGIMPSAAMWAFYDIVAGFD